jgi:hypothetical protein
LPTKFHFAVPVLLCLSLISTGCGPRLASVHEIALDANDIKSILLDPIGKDQIVNVTAKSEGGPIHVHVYLVKDEQAVDDAITLGQATDKVIASQMDSREIVLEALIPANQEAAVRLQPASREDVKVNLTFTNF